MFELGPHGEVDGLEGKEFVQDWVVVVLLQTRSFELLEVKEVNGLTYHVDIVLDAFNSFSKGLKRALRIGQVHREFTIVVDPMEWF